MTPDAAPPQNTAPLAPLDLFERRVLVAGVVAPGFALVVVIVATLLFPGGFDHGKQYISELGAARATWPWVFNYGMIASGGVFLFVALGFFAALRARPWAAACTALSLGAAGMGAMASGFYHMPNPLHQVCELGLFLAASPALTVWACWGRAELRRLTRASLITCAVLVVLFVVLQGWTPFLTVDNVGWWQRAFALMAVVWVGWASSVLLSVSGGRFERGPLEREQLGAA